MQTPLYDRHVELQARMSSFGNWQVPLHYGSVLTEHRWVRSECGVFDVSHMGQISVQGEDAEQLLDYATCNMVTRLTKGQGHYTALLNTKGGIIDDLILYRLGSRNFFLCVNAGNINTCANHLLSLRNKFRRVNINDLSKSYCQLAIQGPRAHAYLRKFLQCHDLALPRLNFMDIIRMNIGKHELYLARSGYTGEVGYELYLASSRHAVAVWDEFIALGVKPIGFGARDTLRLEACYLLHGNDINASITPYEAGISWIVKLNKGNFAGKESLQALKGQGLQRKLYGFKMRDRGCPRQGMEVTDAKKQKIGVVTSGSVLPTVGGFGGLALLDNPSMANADVIYVDNRGKQQQAEITARPFYSARCKDEDSDVCDDRGVVRREGKTSAIKKEKNNV